MKEALKEAKKAYILDEVPIGCIIVKDNEIIARAYNKTRIENSSIYHAEIIAIDIASKHINDFRLNDCTMYVTLEPCPMCAGAIVNSRIKRVVIALSDKRRGACGTYINILNDSNLYHKSEVKMGVLSDLSFNLLNKYFKKLRLKNAKN